jgi:uncharacterized surface protein with fasciclin (FAS1) repeats
LGLTADELLADTDMLTDILTYHVVDGRLTAEDLIAQAGDDGSTTVNTLQGSAILVTVDDGTVYLNRDPLNPESTGIPVTQADQPASNGIVHIIDGVLLPSMAPEISEDPQTANIRFGHFAADATPVEIFIDGEPSAIQELAYPALSGWIEIPVDTYEIAVVPLGGTLENAAIGPLSLSFADNSWTTIAVIGSAEAGTLEANLIFEDYNTALAEDEARLKFFHAIPDAPAVDIIANDEVLVSDLGYPGTQGDNDGAFAIDVPADRYDVQIVPTGQTEPVVISLAEDVEAGNFYFIAAIGTLESPDVFIEVLSVDTETGAAMMEQEGEVLPGETIVGVASNDDRFNTLVSAIEAAGLVETLSGEGPFTVFAPTDAAFEAALNSLGMTAEELLADTELLTQILTYHVVPGNVSAADVVTLDGQSVETVEGSTVDVAVSDEVVTLNEGVTVIQTDIMASNGVIHVIDGVLLPPGLME